MGFTFIDTVLILSGGNGWIFLLQAFLIVAVIWVLMHKKYFQHERNELTDDDIQARIQESLARWNPEDLVLSNVTKKRILNPKILHGKAKKCITVDDQLCLNLSTMNFLDLIGNPKIEDRAIEAIEKYGVGSCGPRGFYGTVEVHLDLEERLAKFMGTEDAIVYSFGFSCIASAIPAYAKRHDIIFADERVNFAIQKGLYASRSTVKYFRHNDHDHLEILLRTQEVEDQQNPEKAAKTRRFVIIEGIYMNTGELVNLPYYMALKEQFKFRLFIDESISFGTVGYGRGVTSHYNIPIKDVDMVMGTLEYAVGSIGGFCCGSKFIIEHQRLSGLGYCFSASQPPLHAVAALTAIDIMEATPLIFTELTTACKSLHKSLQYLIGMEVKGWDGSPVKHLYLRSTYIAEYLGGASQEETLQKISDLCLRCGLSVTCPSYIEKEEKYDPVPSLRICVNRTLQEDEIDKAVHILKRALKEIERSHQTKDDYREARQQPQEVTNRPHHCRQGKAPQQEKVVTEADRLITTYQTSLTPEEKEFIEARQARVIEEEAYRLNMIYQQQVRQAHDTQTGSGQPQNQEDYNQQRKQLTKIAHVEELDDREQEALEEDRQNVQEDFQLIEACQVVCSARAKAHQSELETHQREQGNTQQLNEEDNSTHQIRRRTHL